VQTKTKTKIMLSNKSVNDLYSPAVQPVLPAL